MGAEIPLARVVTVNRFIGILWPGMDEQAGSGNMAVPLERPEPFSVRGYMVVAGK